MTGAEGADAFIFSGPFDVVVDFDPIEDRDRFDLRPASSITSFWDLINGGHLRQVGDDVLISESATDQLRLLDVDSTRLDANDFIF